MVNKFIIRFFRIVFLLIKEKQSFGIGTCSPDSYLTFVVSCYQCEANYLLKRLSNILGCKVHWKSKHHAVCHNITFIFCTPKCPNAALGVHIDAFLGRYGKEWNDIRYLYIPIAISNNNCIYSVVEEDLIYEG